MAQPSPVITISSTPFTAIGSTISIPNYEGTLNWLNGLNTTFTLNNEVVPHTINWARGSRIAIVDGITETVFSKSKTPPPPSPHAKTTHPPSSTSKSYTSSAGPASTSTSSAVASGSIITSSSTSHSTPTQAPQTSNATNGEPTHRDSSSDGISKGATAGIAIGCAAAGALLAALLVFLLMRRRRYSQPSIREYSPERKSPASSNEGAATISRANAQPTIFTVAEREIPQPLEDMAISSEISRLQTLIKNFAQSYYHVSPVADVSIDLSELDSLPMPTKNLAVVLADPKSRLSAIRFCLMWTITSRTTLDSDVRTSLLPPEIINCLSSIPSAKDPSNTPMLAPWRAMTHHLLAPTYPASSTAATRTPNPPNTQLALRTLDTILQPYTDPSRDSYERLSKLEEILRRGARFGWILFGQVAELRVEWRGEDNVRPILVQRTDERGQRFGQGRVLWEGEGWGGVDARTISLGEGREELWI